MSIKIDPDYCKGCELCLLVCKPKALMHNPKHNSKGYAIPVVVEEQCIDCENCAYVCPEMAIAITKEKQL